MARTNGVHTVIAWISTRRTGNGSCRPSPDCDGAHTRGVWLRATAAGTAHLGGGSPNKKRDEDGEQQVHLEQATQEGQRVVQRLGAEGQAEGQEQGRRQRQGDIEVEA